MKWYFVLSESSIDRVDHDWRGLLKVAVRSAREKTNLEPFLLYDGQESSFLDELRDLGVTIIHHRVSFYDRLAEIEKERPGYLSIASGAFMRVDLPMIEKIDEFIFYSDCDVLFCRNIDLSNIKPTYFAAAPQSSKEDYENDMNSGVMVVNIPAMRAVRPWFIEFITANLRSGWPGFDQENYRRFFRAKWDRLPLELNWKPYWGVSTDVGLIHWHGPKPTLVQQLVSNPRLATVEVWKRLFESHPESYRYYLRAWEKVADTESRAVRGHMDIFSPLGGAGWAAYKDKKAGAVSFSVWIDGTKVSDVICDRPRADIKALYGTDTAGFEFGICNRYLDGTPHKLELRDKDGALVRLKHKGLGCDSYTFEV